MADNARTIEYVLDYSRHWQEEPRRWFIRGGLLSGARDVELSLDGAPVPREKYKVESECIILQDGTIAIEEGTRAVIHFQLSWFSAREPRWQALFIALVGIVPATLSAVLVYLVGVRQIEVQARTQGVIEAPEPWAGAPLASYADYYPVEVTNGRVSLDRARAGRAIRHFHRHDDPRAIADLVHLLQANNADLTLDEDLRAQLGDLVALQRTRGAEDVEREREYMMQSYADIVNAIGRTLAGTPFEIVLHDVRNPLHTIVAIQNPITGRRLGDPLTDFGVRLIRHYAESDVGAQSYISYPLHLRGGRHVKSTTIPLFHPSLGLIAFICINIDVDDLVLGPDLESRWLHPLARVFPQVGIEEVIDAAGMGGGVFAADERPRVDGGAGRADASEVDGGVLGLETSADPASAPTGPGSADSPTTTMTAGDDHL